MSNTTYHFSQSKIFRFLCLLFIISTTVIIFSYFTESQQNSISESLVLIEDPNGILNEENAYNKLSSKTNTENRYEYLKGFSSSVFWVMIDRNIQFNDDIIYFSSTLIDSISLYKAENNNIEKIEEIGNTTQSRFNTIESVFPAFKVNGNSKSLMFKIKGSNSISISAFSLPEKNFKRLDTGKIAYLISFYVLMIIFAILNFVFFVDQNEKAFSNYSIYVFLFILMTSSLDGTLHYFFTFPSKGLPFLAAWSPLLVSVFILMLNNSIFGVFIKAKNNKYSLILKILLYICLSVAIISLFPFVKNSYISLASIFIGFISVIFVVISSCISIKYKLRNYSLNYLIAWIIQSIGVGFCVSKLLGFNLHFNYSDYSMHVGGLIESIIISSTLIYDLFKTKSDLKTKYMEENKEKLELEKKYTEEKFNSYTKRMQEVLGIADIINSPLTVFMTIFKNMRKNIQNDKYIKLMKEPLLRLIMVSKYLKEETEDLKTEATKLIPVNEEYLKNKLEGKFKADAEKDLE